MITFINKKTDDQNDESNVIDSKALSKRSKKTLKTESKVFANTLGPAGMNTIIEDKYLKHVITKDGYTVYQSLVFYNKIDRIIAKLIQKISGSVNEIVGDGTTSAVVCANELLRLKKLIRKHNITAKILTDTIKEVSILINARLKDSAIKIFNENDGSRCKFIEKDEDYKKLITNIAAISLNNDYTSGKIISDLYTSLSDPLNGSVNIELSPTDKTTFNKDRGFELCRGFIMSEMVTEADSKSASYIDPNILLIKGTLMSTDAEALNTVINLIIGKLGQPLVIIAGGFSREIYEIIRQSILMYEENQHKVLPLLCVEVDNSSSIGNEEFLDLSANVGANIITVDSSKPFPDLKGNEAKWISSFGHCNKIIARSTETRIIGGKIDKAKVEFRVAEINKTIEEYKSEEHLDNYFNIFRLNRRKSALMNDMITLLVGGNSAEEKENRSHLYDDAARGCKSAFKNGLLCGGNTAVARVCYKMLNKSNISWLKNEASVILKNIGYSDMIDENKFYKLVKDIIKEIEIAYIRSYAIIINNKFNSWFKSYSLAKKCIKNNKLYNLVTGKYESVYDNIDINTHLTDAKTFISNCKVINSAETDMQILTVAVSIIDLIISSNQLLRTPESKQMINHM